MSRITVGALALLALLGAGCGDDDGAGAGGTSGSSGTGGAGTGGAGTGGAGTGGDPGLCTGDATDDPNCINELCPDVSPTDGERAMKGACCFRVSNADRARAAWNDTTPGATRLATIEFRQNALTTTSQPTTVGQSIIQLSLADTYRKDWSNTLVRIEGIPATGEADVTVTIGAGRSNCDGTYSFYGDAAAPDFGAGDAPLVERTAADRWAPAVMTGHWNWASDEKLTIETAERAPGVRWAPVAKDHGLLGYEQPSQDLNYEFSFEGMSGTDVTAEALNCVGGEIGASEMWTTGLVQTVFFPVAELETAMLDSAAITQNFCSFMGVRFNASKLCSEVPRVAPDGCVPNSAMGMYCGWTELPFGMCDADHCYVGKEDHPRANCGGTTGNECCDPTGVDDTKPACNAFLIEATAVLAGAEITDEPANDPTVPFPDCTAF